MKSFSLIFNILFLSFSSLAQVQSEPKPFIEITGTSEIKVDPDRIYIRVSLQENLDRSKKTLTEKEQELIKALASINILKERITVTDAHSTYGKTGVMGKEVVSEKNIEIEAHTSTEVKKAFEELDRLNIKSAYIVRVDHSKMEDYKKQARIQAIKAAKTKADYLLLAIGEELGKALIIKDYSTQIPELGILQMANARMSYDDVYENDMREENLDFKQITISARIYTKWQIGKGM